MAFQYAVVLTGSIGTGKSTAAGFLRKEGFEMIDADHIAHTVLDQEYKEIKRLFGDEVVHGTKVDRKALGQIVFGDEQKRKVLEGLLHPLIYAEIERSAKALDQRKKPYLIDIPLFFETNRYPIDKCVVVYTPQALQVERLMQRDKSTREDAQKRIATQIAIEEKMKKANYVIDNSGTLAQLERECTRVTDKILKDFT